VFEFAYIWVFWLAPLPLLIIFLLPAVTKRRNALAAPFFDRLVKASGQKPSKGVSIARRRIPAFIVLILVWLFVLAALASPQLVGEPEQKIKTARSMMLAVDISGSMTTSDWKIDDKRVSRWEAVKSVMDEFIQRRQGDRLGLLFFGTQAYLQTPFTLDLEMVNQMLNEVEVGMAGQKTALGNAIGRSIELFEADSVDKKVLILITDGVDSGSEINPVQGARTAALDSIVIYTIGMGDPNAGLFDLDEKTLKLIASETGGKYFRAIDRKELEKVYGTIDQLEPIEYEDESYRPVELLYFWPLSAALALAVIYQVLVGTITLIKRIRWKNS
jgi:Ca-activated chloride channel family protein